LSVAEADSQTTELDTVVELVQMMTIQELSTLSAQVPEIWEIDPICQEVPKVRDLLVTKTPTTKVFVTDCRLLQMPRCATTLIGQLVCLTVDTPGAVSFLQRVCIDRPIASIEKITIDR